MEGGSGTKVEGKDAGTDSTWRKFMRDKKMAGRRRNEMAGTNVMRNGGKTSTTMPYDR